MNNKLGSYIAKKGNFKLEDNGCLGLDDFDKIYQIIECGCRVKLQILRGKNESGRKALFEKAFFK